MNKVEPDIKTVADHHKARCRDYFQKFIKTPLPRKKDYANLG